MLFMRSCDIFLGAPFNIASYAVLLEMLAYATGRTARFLKVTYGDLHLYSNHIDQANLQLSRPVRELPSLTVKPEEWPAGSVFSRFMSFTPNDLHLEGYDPHPAIKAEVAV
jgi:thymidylate synthase